MKVAVVGTGYVGLVTGACFAEVGNRVHCLDIDESKIAQLKEGQLPFFEPGLREKVRAGSESGRLTFTTDYAVAITDADFVFLALPTPSSEDGSADLSYLRDAATTLRPFLAAHAIVVMKSTAPVGTTQLLSEWLSPNSVISNPEFLKQGNAVADFMRPDRILIGANSEGGAEPLRKLYAPFSRNHDRILVMDVESAEMAKYASNAMLATRISFMNDLARLCEVTGADVSHVRLAMGSDTRIGYHFLYAGAGYGGSCFPKDVAALRAMAGEHDFSMPVIEAVEATNERQKQLLGEKITFYFSSRGGLEGKTITILGLAFKPDTDDMRGAPALTLIHTLLEEGVFLRLYDPVAMERAKALLHAEPTPVWCENEEEAAIGADALVLATEWKQFRFLDFANLRQKMAGRALFDGRNQYQPEEMRNIGFDYICIGRAPALQSETEESLAAPTGIHS